MSVVRRIADLFTRSRVDREIDLELQSHINMRIDDNLAAGMSAAEARRDALLRFGNPTATREERRLGRPGSATGKPLVRSPLCPPPVAPLAWVCLYGSAHARSGHRRQRSGIQRPQFPHSAPVECASAGEPLRHL